MTLDEAIHNYEEKTDDTPCGQEHRQLALWLKELRERRRADYEGKDSRTMEWA